MPILTSTHYPQIRAALDLRLSAATLPDAVIAYDIYSGRADDMVLGRMPAATAADKWALRAAIFYCAAFLAAAIPHMSSEIYKDYEYERDMPDWDELAALNLSRAGEAMAELLTGVEEADPEVGVVITVAHGYRTHYGLH